LLLAVYVQGVEGFRPESERSEDPICALTASDKYLLVGRQSGLVQQYGLPTIRSAPWLAFCVPMHVMASTWRPRKNLYSLT
jgi:hypothetical protein